MKRWENSFSIQEMLETMNQEYKNMDEDISYPPEIVEWIARLKLLKGVPLSCLAGDEKQLPPESIRFFHVDESWTDQLINGALSIGVTDTKARFLNLFFTEDFHDAGRNNMHLLRERRVHEEQKIFCKRSCDFSDRGKLTGFLLRSRLTRIWKGLETVATDSNGTLLEILRMEQLSDEIMICLYNGEIANVHIREPKEGLRFGTGKDRKIKVRDTKPGNEGNPLPDEMIAINTNDYGRADILSLAQELKKTLNTQCMTSAELAMELIVAQGQAEFSRKQEDDKDGFETTYCTISD